jgi:hypothetical protein
MLRIGGRETLTHHITGSNIATSLIKNVQVLERRKADILLLRQDSERLV